MSEHYFYWCTGTSKVDESLEVGYAVGSYCGSYEYPFQLVERAKQTHRAIYIAHTINDKIVEEEAYLSNGQYIHRVNGEEQVSE